MIQKKPKQGREPILPLSGENDMALSLGGAGASLVILLSTLQLWVGASEPKLRSAFEWPILMAILSLAFWIALWKLCDTHAYWKRKCPNKVANLSSHQLMVIIFSCAIATLAGSIGSLVRIAYPLAELAFLGAVLLLVAVLILHNRAFKKFGANAPVQPRRLRKPK